jgi:hypothetical protein
MMDTDSGGPREGPRPWCPRNEKYAASVREAFLSGDSPSDFPEEHYERNWPDRFQPEQLNDTGRRGLGMR